MPGPHVRLTAPDLLSALAALDSLAPCADELLARTAQDTAVAPTGELSALPGAELTELTLLEHGARTRFLLPSAGLRASHAAALAAVAANALLARVVVTAAVLGSGREAQPQLMTIAKFVPAVSHIAVCPVGVERSRTVAPQVLDQISQAGIGLSLNPDVRQTVFGANLVVDTAERPGPLHYAELTRGSVLVNASGTDLPDDLVDRIDKVYADAPELMGEHLDRYFVRRHFDTAAQRPVPVADVVAHPPGTVVGLGEVLRGTHQPHAEADEIRLVELLSPGGPDLRLAAELCRTARFLGLGSSYGPDLN